MQPKDFLKLNLRKKIIASVVVCILFLFSIVYFIIVPSVKDIRNIGSEIEEQRIDLEKKYLRGQNLKKLAEKLAKVEGKIKALDQVFINQNRGLEFITTLERVAAENNVSQKINLLTVPSENEDFFKKTPLQLFTQGSFLKQLSYLMGLENLNYYVNINSFEISAGPPQIPISGSETVSYNNVNLLISADTYWR